jgi:hypothetical protein
MRLQFRSLALAALTVACLAGAVAAQEAPKPGPEMAVLKEAEGTWDALINSQGSESKGVLTSRLGLNGLWLMDQFTGDFSGLKFEGRGATSYDPNKKKYTGIWIDSMTPSPMVLEGTYNAATKTMTMTGMMPMPDGTTAKLTQTTVTKDADTRVFTMSMQDKDGKDFVMLTITYKRRK